MFYRCGGYKKSPLHLCRGRVYPVVPPQFTALPRPQPVIKDRTRDIGRTRLRLLQRFSRAARKSIRCGPSAALHRPAALWQKDGARTWFRHRVFFCILYHFFKSMSRQTTATIYPISYIYPFSSIRSQTARKTEKIRGTRLFFLSASDIMGPKNGGFL